MPNKLEYTARPEVFNVPPPKPKTKKPGQLTDKQVNQFFKEGFLILEEYFDIESQLQPVRDDINEIVDNLANRLYNAGKIKKLYKDCGLFQRLSKLEEDFPGANIVMAKEGKLATSIRDLWSNDRLLNLVEQLLGSSDIVGHPVWNLRTKTPRNEATTVPWHQDVAYLDSDSYDILQPTAWIPLLDTNDVNGCMQVARGGHRSGKVAKHTCCFGTTHYVMLDEEEMVNTLGVNLDEDLVTCPIPYGGMLLINNLIPHRSFDNMSNSIRWSLDLRWQRADKPVGFHGLKKGVLMRSSKGKVDIDWDGFNVVKEDTGQSKTKSQLKPQDENKDEFSTVISGPWMKIWDIVHENKHTEQSARTDGVTWHNS